LQFISFQRTYSKSEVRHLVNKGKINLIKNHNKLFEMCEKLKSSENNLIQPVQYCLIETTKDIIPVKEVVKSSTNNNIDQNSNEISQNEYTHDIELTEEQILNSKVSDGKSTQNIKTTEIRFRRSERITNTQKCKKYRERRKVKKQIER